MAELPPDLPPEDSPEAAADAPPRRRWSAVLRAIAIACAALVAVLAAGLWWLSETAGGRAFVATHVADLPFKSGMRIHVGRIDGSLLSAFDLADVRIDDLDGRLVTVPSARVVWRPWALWRKRVEIETLDVPELRLARMWHLNPSDPDEPLLPNIDIGIGRFTLRQLVLEAPLLGRRETARAAGRLDIRRGRVLVDLTADSTADDHVRLLLDAEPDGDRFDLSADVTGPAGGLLATAAGIDRPLTLTASGKGGWQRWRGRLEADVGENTGADPAKNRVAALDLAMDGGRLRVRGNLAPQPFLPEAARKLADPVIRVDFSVAGQGDLYTVRLEAGSAAFRLAAGGQVDPQRNRAVGLRLTAAIRQPAALHPNLSGEGVQATLAGDGAIFGDPWRWTFAARRLRFAGKDGPLGGDGLAASGTVRLASGKKPLAADFDVRLARLVGLPEAAAGLADRPHLIGRVQGDDKGGFRLEATRLTTAALSLVASGQMAADGQATATLDARIARYPAPQLGPVTAEATARIGWHPERGLTASGRFDGRTLGLAAANSSAAQFLGGEPRLRGQFALGADGVARVSAVDFLSPNVQFQQASASYALQSGVFFADARGNSRAYGAIAVTASGTVAAPVAEIRVDRPDFGIGLTDLVVGITPRSGGISGGISGGLTVAATGTSPEGDVDVLGGVLYGGGQPLTVEIDRARLAGLVARGRLVQTAAGPFAGRLLVGGRGLQAKVDLAAAGQYQRADILASADKARLPLDPVVVIGKAAAKISVVLVPGKPEIRGSFRGSGISRDGMQLTAVEGAADLAGLGGAARLTVAGKAGSGMTFTAAGGVRSVGSGYAVTLDGSIGKQKFGLARPARLVYVDKRWVLQAARIDLPKGQVDVSGRFGGGVDLDLALRDVDLGIAEVLPAGSGIGGTANGRLRLRYEGGRRLPTGAVDLTISGLSRAGITGVTIPTDVRISGNSDGERLLLGGHISYQQRELGRLVVRVDPGAGETPGDRFMAGALTGGIRFNGPVEPLWAFVQMEGQELRGSLAIGADLGGSPANPDIHGTVRGRNLLYRNAMLGSELTDMALDGSFTGSSFMLDRFTGKAHGGELSGSGFVRLSADADPQVNLKLELKKAKLANSDMIELSLSGPLTLVGRLNDATLAGNLQVDDARIQIVQLQNSEIPQIRVRRAGDLPAQSAESDLAAANLKLDLRVKADSVIRVEGMGLDSFWRADIRVRGTAANPRILGSATLDRGEFEFASSDFEITRGRVIFNGQPLESSLDIQAQTQAADVLAILNVAGTAMRPELRFSSTPTLPEDEILSRLLFGTSVADLSVTEAVQLATAVAGLQSGVDTMGKIRRSVGLDRLRLVGDNAENGMGTGLALGKRLTRNVYAEVVTDSQGNTLTSLQLTLSRLWSLFVDVSSQGRTSANIRHQREY